MKYIRIAESIRSGFWELQENRFLLFWKRFGGRIYVTPEEANLELGKLFTKIQRRVSSDGNVIYACDGERK